MWSAEASRAESVSEQTAENQKGPSHPDHIHVEIAHMSRETFHRDSSNLSGAFKKKEGKRQITCAHAGVGMATAPVVPSLLSMKHRKFNGAPIWRQAPI